jgi:hypothetical protein
MNESRRALPPLLVERFLAGTLSDAERVVFLGATSEQERTQLSEEHGTLQAELLRQRSPAEFANVIHARAEREGRATTSSAPRVVRALAFASLIGALVFVARDALREPDARAARQSGVAQPTQAETERAKGLAPSLRVYRRRADGPQLLADGQRVEAGDVLQLGYVAPGMSHAVLLSLDGRGQVTLHWPASKEASTQLSKEAQGEQLLPTAYELDDAPRFERFVLITARRSLHVPELLRAARDLARQGAQARSAPLLLPVHTEQVSVWLDKGGP